ncbi:MAG: response regulator transcription factor [Firmicutes bacterium]|nr:response regulator transcription factor [Bacillota bacterium]
MTTKLRVYLCDDHTILREGLRNLLNAEPDLCVIGEGADGDEALCALRTLPADVVLMDIHMPGRDGIETIASLQSMRKDLPVLVLTMYAQEEYLFRAIQAGAKGYLLKDSPIGAVVEGIRKVASGGSALQTGHRPHADLNTVTTYDSTDLLSPREVEVLTVLVEGLSNKSISEKLYISETTVKLHISNIYRKLGVRSRSQAVVHAIRHQLVPVDPVMQ